jgi:hypothetical protein
MFGGSRPVRLPDAPFGPMKIFLPDPSLLANAKAGSESERLIHVYLRSRSDFDPTKSVSTASVVPFVEKFIVPRLPDAASVGLDEAEWPPTTKLASAISYAFALADAPIGKAPTGAVAPGKLLAAHAEFSNLDSEPVVDALLVWMSWVSLVARANDLEGAQLGVFFRVCLLHADDLQKLASDR